MAVLDNFKLDGKVALVTGAGSGLGWAYAEAMAEAGADIACVDIDEAGANKSAATIRALGRRAIAIKTDISQEAAVRAMVARCVEELGRLDILFANAGITTKEPKLFTQGELENWQRVVNVDLTGTYLTAKEAAKVMIPQKQGKIICTSSVMGLVSHEDSAPAYNASKSGVISLTRTLAVQLAPHNIQVNSIAPGRFSTSIGRAKIALQENPDEETRQLLAKRVEGIPLGRFGELADIKGLAVFLASSASDYITGTTIIIDGGWLARIR